MDAPREPPRDRLLANAGGLLMASGFIAAFTGGTYGLAHTRPGLVILSVVLLMGYGIVGYLVMTRGARHFQVALPGTAVLVVATLFLFNGMTLDSPEDDFTQFVLYPGLSLVLSFAGGALLTHVVEASTDRARWPAKGRGAVNTLLHLAAASPIWCAFTLVAMMGPTATALGKTLIVGGSIAVALAAVVGGYAAARGSHPGFTLAGAAAAFGTAALYLFQFMLQPGRDHDAAFFGQFVALLGLILTGLPVAISAVAWLQLASGDADAAPEEGPALPPQ